MSECLFCPPPVDRAHGVAALRAPLNALIFQYPACFTRLDEDTSQQYP